MSEAHDKPAGDKPEDQPEQASEAAKPEGEDAAKSPAPAKDGAEEPSPVIAEADKKIFGVSVHNLIFVGIVLGILIGWITHSIEHEDKLILVQGQKEVIGKVRETKSEILVMTEQGEERYKKSEVAEIVRATDTSGGQWYAILMWWYNLLGKTIFMGALKMLIAPLILASIVAGIVSLKGLDQLKRIGVKTFAYYFCTTGIAVSIGLVAVLLIRPGHKAASKEIRAKRERELKTREGDYKEATGKAARREADGEPTPEFLTWLAADEARRAGEGVEAKRFAKLSGAQETNALDMFRDKIIKPMLTNPFESVTTKNSLGIISFAVIFGIAVVVIGGPAKPVADFFIAFNEVIISITKWLMSLAPICIMFIVAELIGENGPNVFGSLAWYCVTVIAGIAVHLAFLVFVAKTLGGTGPLQLWNGIREAWLVAFTTRSSAATLPVTMRCVTENLGVSPRVANFGLPVGATMNMDGTALYEGVAIIFMIQIYQGLPDVAIVLGGAVTLTIFVTAVLASVGAAAVPDAGLVTMVLVANAVGLPVYYIPLIFAVDAFLDMFRTSTNVLGDAIGTLVVQRFEDRAALKS